MTRSLNRGLVRGRALLVALSILAGCNAEFDPREREVSSSDPEYTRKFRDYLALENIQYEAIVRDSTDWTRYQLPPGMSDEELSDSFTEWRLSFKAVRWQSDEQVMEHFVAVLMEEGIRFNIEEDSEGQWVSFELTREQDESELSKRAMTMYLDSQSKECSPLNELALSCDSKSKDDATWHTL